MTHRIVVLIALAMAAGTAAWWWRYMLCETDCAAADHRAQEMFQRGELLETLKLIAKTDSRCRCERFTSGDTPPQYALAQACVRRLHSEGRIGEVQDLLAKTRSSILKEVAREVLNDAKKTN